MANFINKEGKKEFWIYIVNSKRQLNKKNTLITIYDKNNDKKNIKKE